MPRSFDALERQVFLAFEQAVADKRLDVADHLLYALDALDPEFEGPAIRRACRSILEPASGGRTLTPLPRAGTDPSRSRALRSGVAPAGPIRNERAPR